MGQQVKDSYGPMIFNTNAQLDGVNFLMAKFKKDIFEATSKPCK